MPIRVVIAALLCTGVAHADPAPNGLAELTPRTQLEAQFGIGSGVLLAWDVHAAAGGRIAINDAFEVFGSIPVRGLMVSDLIDEGAPEDNGAVGSIRAGGRAMTSFGNGAVGAAAWMWVPTQDNELDMRNQYLWGSFDGLQDARLFMADRPAAGFAVDIAHRNARGYAQLQLGVAMVSDHGAQVASTFGTAMIGRQISSRTSLHGGYRIEIYPDETLHMPSFAIGRNDTRYVFTPLIHDNKPIGLGFTIQLLSRASGAAGS